MAVEVDAVQQLNAKLTGKLKTDLHWGIFDSVTEATNPVTSARVVAAQDMVFDKAQLTSLPDIALLAQKRLLNCGDAQLTSTISLSITGTRSWNVSKTEGVKTTVGGTLKGAIEDILDIGLSWNEEISSSTTIADTQTVTVTRTMSDSVLVGPNKAINVSLVAYQKSIRIPFTAKVTVDADFTLPNAPPNSTIKIVSDGRTVNKASDVLSTEDRTFQVVGELTVTDVTDATIRTDNLIGTDGCTPGIFGTFTHDIPQQSLKPEEVAASFLKPLITSELIEEAQRRS